jgi:hypothetical protein
MTIDKQRDALYKMEPEANLIIQLSLPDPFCTRLPLLRSLRILDERSSLRWQTFSRLRMIIRLRNNQLT